MADDGSRGALDPLRAEAVVAFLRQGVAKGGRADAGPDGGAGLGLCEGREAIFNRFLEPTLKFSWHYFVKPRIEVDGDTARATWDILAPCTTRDDRAMWMSGVEDDEYVKQDDVWLHRSMKLRVVFMVPHDRGWASRGTAAQAQ